ncbi:hypothetical protein ABT112_32640 [Streptomyces sp. NPDC002055]|uniref:hypothetical protein n=1 Tax=Streptomyces sp. NPDC002055 TaxID=3154534 RepID=UPI0033255AC0
MPASTATRRAYREVTTRREDRMSAQPDQIVAYQHPDLSDVLLCREHGEGWAGLIPLTSHDLPFVGFCSWGTEDDTAVCGRALLMKKRKSSR